ncbi:MAG: hypothetical protein LBU88_04015 [Treponema sp.]|nr:hypothetical protein [Treponema sp.]
MKRLFFICLFSTLLFSFSCSARINGSLSADGSASISINASLGTRITTLIRTIAAAGGQTGGGVLDGEVITRSMSGAPGITSASFRNTSPSAIEGTVRISQIGDFLSGTGSGGFVVFEQGSSGGRCVININRTNGPGIIKLLSPDIDMILNALMAPIVTEDTMTKTEYLEIIEVFYSKAISDEIASSRIRASIDFPGTITSVRGGTYSGRRAEFDIALVDLLVLENPVNLEVRWR